MSLLPFERMHSLTRSPFSMMEPSWDLAMAPPAFDTGFTDMEKRMRHMEHHMNDMFRTFNKMAPVERRVQTWGSENIHPEFSNDMLHDQVVTDKEGNKKMALQFDVQHFKPEEISIKTKNNVLTVHARQENTSDNAAMYREYNRQYTLPEGVNLEEMKSVMSPEGILCIEAPLPHAIQAARENVIPIEHH